jgi:hypothetical protein
MIFAAEEARLATGEQSVPVSLEMLTEHVRANLVKQDKGVAAAQALEPPVDWEDRKERMDNADEEISILRNQWDPRCDEWVSLATDRILNQVDVTPTDDVLASFADVVRRAEIELLRRKIDRYRDRYDRPFHDSLFDPTRPATVTFDELATNFLAERMEYYKLNNISTQRSEKVVAVVHYLREAVGKTTAVHAIDDDVVQQISGLVARTPTNVTKKYPGLPLAKAVEVGAKDSARTLSVITQRTYLDVFRDLLQMAVRKKLLASNPAEGVIPILKDTVAAGNKRLQWTDEQIVGFFTGKFYQSCSPSAVKQYDRPDRSWRFWLPLLMLLSGARPNEIAQLEGGDLKCTAAGTAYLDLIDEGEDGTSKKLKTVASRRRVPVHPTLINLGFATFAKGRKAAPDGPKMFPSLRPNKYSNFAWYSCKRFNEVFIPAEIVLGERQSLYSLRHNVRDALRRAKTPPGTLRHVGGWAQAKAVSDDYGDAGNPDFHVEYVVAISYPGLDFSFLLSSDENEAGDDK